MGDSIQLPVMSQSDEDPRGDSGSAQLRPIPIFVVGMTRSGTKWLSNLLSAHEDVASVQNKRHGGILETSIFDATQRKFDLSSDDDFAAFIELWSRSDFFREAGSKKSLFFGLPEFERDYLRLFEILMDDLALRRGCRHWLQKISPHVALPVIQKFSTSRIVVIKRRLLDVLRSQAALDAHHSSFCGIYQTAYDYVFQEKYIARIRRRFADVAYVTYEDLYAETNPKIRDLCTQLGLSDASADLESTFPANTSFPRFRTPLPRHMEFVGTLLAALLRVSPLFAMKGFSTIKRIMQGGNVGAFYSGEFGLLKDSVRATSHNKAV